MDHQGTLADGVETGVHGPIVGLPIGSIIAKGRIRLCPVPTSWNMSLAEPRDLFTGQTRFVYVFLAVDNLPGTTRLTDRRSKCVYSPIDCLFWF